MTTILTGINWAYLCAIVVMLAVLIAFSAYDIKTKRVPNRGLACFMPVVFASMILRFISGQWDSVLLFGLYCFAGVAAGGGVLLTAALATKGGIGGGDIKLAALIGLFYGPYNMLAALLIGTPLSILYGLIKRRRSDYKELHIAFVPFITFGCLMVSLFLIKGVFAS